LTWKKAQAHESSFSSRDKNFGSQKSSKKIKGAQKKILYGWSQKASPFSKILKAQIKNPFYFKKKNQRWSDKKIINKSSIYFPFFLEKVNENEKVKLEKNQINFMDLRIDGVYVLNLIKKKEKNQKQFSIEQKNFGILQLLNKSSLCNPDLQTSHSIFFSFPETKKMIEFDKIIPFDYLRGFLLQSFSSLSGSFFSKKLLTNKFSSDFKTKKINTKALNLLEKKKSIMFRKKRFRIKKKFYKKNPKFYFNFISLKKGNFSKLEKKLKNKKRFLVKKDFFSKKKVQLIKIL